MAEVLLRHALRTAAPADPPISVGSAGLLGAGMPASPGAVEVMAERGLDLSGHVSRRLDATLVGQSDLVVGMAREHVREAVVLVPVAWSWTFTLKELIRAAGAFAPRQPGETLAGWLRLVGEGRTPSGLVGDDPVDDVADPMGRALGFYRETAAEIEQLIGALVDAAFAAAGDRGAA